MKSLFFFLAITFFSILFFSCDNQNVNKLHITYEYHIDKAIPDSLQHESNTWIQKTISGMPHSEQTSIYDVERIAIERFGNRTEGLLVHYKEGIQIEFVPKNKLLPHEISIFAHLKSKQNIRQ